MNKIIFGGAFDPVHNGHLNMALNAAKQLAGEVIFVPAPISVWKQSSAPIKDKIAMLKLAIKDYSEFSIDEYEINSGKEINYSIDTVRHFKKKYPNDKLFYLIGTDQVNRFHQWKEAEELSKLAQIVFFIRPGSEIHSENVEKYHMIQIVGQKNTANSTEIRKLRNYEVPADVLFYIIENEVYEGVVELKSLLTPHRYAHCKSVASVAYQIAISNKLENPLDYYMAALFHDIGKDIPKEEQKELIEKYFPKYENMPGYCLHQFAGAALARIKFGIEKKEMLEAIEFHCTGNENMGLMAKVIYASDKIEPTRGFDSSDLINAMKKDAEEGFKIVLEANREFLSKKEETAQNELTSKCFAFYLK